MPTDPPLLRRPGRLLWLLPLLLLALAAGWWSAREQTFPVPPFVLFFADTPQGEVRADVQLVLSERDWRGRPVPPITRAFFRGMVGRMRAVVEEEARPVNVVVVVSELHPGQTGTLEPTITFPPVRVERDTQGRRIATWGGAPLVETDGGGDQAEDAFWRIVEDAVWSRILLGIEVG